MFPVSITLHNSAQLNAVLAALGTEGFPTEDANAKKPATKPAQPARTEPTAPAEQADAPASKATDTKQSPKGSPAADAPAAADGADEAVTYQSVANAITDLGKTKGRDAAVAVLAKFGAKRGTDLKPEQYADVIAACEEAA